MHACAWSYILRLFFIKFHMHVHILSLVHEFILFLRQLSSFEQVIEALDLIEHMHVTFEVCSWIIVEIVFNWLTFGPWFYKLSFESCYIMSLKVFSRKVAQNDRIWYIETWFWAWGSNLEIPDFGLPLERGKWHSSGKFAYPALLLCLQSARAGIERLSSVIFTDPVLLQSARAGKFTLERRLLFACSLERDLYFLKILKIFLKSILASSFLSRHS